MGRLGEAEALLDHALVREHGASTALLQFSCANLSRPAARPATQSRPLDDPPGKNDICLKDSH